MKRLTCTLPKYTSIVLALKAPSKMPYVDSAAADQPAHNLISQTFDLHCALICRIG